MERKLKFVVGYLWAQIQTTIHKFWVAYYLFKISNRICPEKINYKEKMTLFKRAVVHDLSKYRWIEAKYFGKTVFRFKKCTYGTQAYKDICQEIRPSIDHHYSHNSHHPQYYPNKFQGMSKLDKIEMAADWASSIRRNRNGCIHRSLEINQDKFGYSDQDKKELLDIIHIVL